MGEMLVRLMGMWTLTLPARHQPRTSPPASLRAVTDLRPTPAAITELVAPILENRYSIDEPLAHGRLWHAFRGQDLRLRRPVVLRVAHSTTGDPSSLYQRVERARAGARITVHQVAQVYDALVVEQPTGTTAIIITEYADGPGLGELDHAAAADELSGAVSTVLGLVTQVEAEGISLGRITPDHVVTTPEGIVLTALPRGPLAQHGPTDIRPITALLRRSASGERRSPRTWFTPRLTRSA